LLYINTVNNKRGILKGDFEGIKKEGLNCPLCVKSEKREV
jgi:hypothetical protein